MIDISIYTVPSFLRLSFLAVLGALTLPAETPGEEDGPDPERFVHSVRFPDGERRVVYHAITNSRQNRHEFVSFGR